MGAHRISALDVRTQFPAGTALHDPSAASMRASSSTCRACGVRALAVPGAAVPGAHLHPGQEECFEVLDGVMGYRRDAHRGELRAGESVTVPPGVVHDWWNAGDRDLRARVTVMPPGRFTAMIAAAWGLAAVGRTNAKGMPGPVDAALLAEAFGEEIVFERPPRAVQQALAHTVAPIARRRGRSVTREVMRAGIIPSERWPAQRDGGTSRTDPTS